MVHTIVAERSTMIVTDREQFNSRFAQDIHEGFNDSPKYIPYLYFYDYQGSLLFEEICELPEYYLTKAEAQILQEYSEKIISLLPDNVQLADLGSGSSIKTELIIKEMLNQYGNLTYSPIDISKKMLQESSLKLLEKYPHLQITSVAAEYAEGIRQLTGRVDRPKLILWLGSSIGNFEIKKAIQFLRAIVKALSHDDFFLIGFDLHKEKGILENAYNDSQKITAQFNLNLLARINRNLGSEFDLNKFRHQAVYNEEKKRIEMYLISTCEQEVYIAQLNKFYRFKENEKIHTENSYKYSLNNIRELAQRAGLTIVDQWFDQKKYFNLTLFKPAHY